jgi:BASS family bile acid:Na+ symporter
MLARFLLLWLIALSALAFAWPTASESLPIGQFDPFTASGRYLPWLIAATMFAIGLMLPRDEVRQVLHRWPTVLAGTALQYSVMPFLAYAMAVLWRLEGEFFVGMVVVGCVPGAMASNVLTLNAGGNTSYSVSLTTTATLLSPVVVPLVMQFALSTEESVQLDPWRTSLMLLATVVGPVVAGHLIGRRLSEREAQLRYWGSTAANLAILWIIAVVVGLNRDRLAELRFDLLGALLMVNLAGYTAGYLGGWSIKIPEPMRRALTLEIGMQNAGLGATLATQLFPEQHAIAIAPALYTFGCMLTGTMLARVWAGTRGDESRRVEE